MFPRACRLGGRLVTSRAVVPRAFAMMVRPSVPAFTRGFGDRGDRPDRPDRPDRSDRPDRPDRPARPSGDRPERPARDRPQREDRGDRKDGGGDRKDQELRRPTERDAERRQRDRERRERERRPKEAPKGWIDDPKEHRYYITGTWNEWSKWEEMLPDKKGETVSYSMRMGSNKWEQFQIVQDEDWKKRIYPERPAAPQSAVVKGPQDDGHEYNWMIDSRKGPDEGSEGDLFNIGLELTHKNPKLNWTKK